MPISFSALCIMSLVMRGAGVGDGRGEGDGVGVCASAFSGDFDTASPAAPAAGSSLTKLRRLMRSLFDFDLFIESSLFTSRDRSLRELLLWNHDAAAYACKARLPVFHLHDLRLARAIDGDDEKIVVLQRTCELTPEPAPDHQHLDQHPCC